MRSSGCSASSCCATSISSPSSCGPRAATLGKRALGLRVAARDGGRLTADAVYRPQRHARDRDLPAALLPFATPRGRQVGGWMILAGLVWSACSCSSRCSTATACGSATWSPAPGWCKAPRRSCSPTSPTATGRTARGFAFTPAQLDAYGIKELHVLEDVLRAATAASGGGGRPHPPQDRLDGARKTADRDLPQRLLRRPARHAWRAGLLFGQRRKDKFDRLDCPIIRYLAMHDRV